MIGVSMILTIAVCALGFTVLYTALDGFTSDFISQSDETPTEAPQVAQQDPNQNTEQETDTPAAQPQQQQATQAPETQQQPQQQDPQPTATATGGSANDGEFTPDYQIGSDVTINLREGPSTATSILEGLPPATPLEYLDEDEPTDDPSDGERWMKFETEDGLVGWVREIDVTEYEP
jgi:hypothetical protein